MIEKNDILEKESGVILMAETIGGDEKMKGALSYLVGPVTGIFFILVEKKSGYIRFHAMQSTVVFGGLMLLNIVLGIVPVLGWIISVLINIVLIPVSFILWLVLMWKAYSGEKYKVPYFGDLAEKQLNKLGK